MDLYEKALYSGLIVIECAMGLSIYTCAEEGISLSSFKCQGTISPESVQIKA